MIEIRENDKSWDLGTLFSDKATAPSCPDCYIPLDKHLHRLDLHQSKAGSKQHVLNMPTFNALHQEMRASNGSEQKTAPGELWELLRTHRTGEQSWISSSMASKRDSSKSSMPVPQICDFSLTPGIRSLSMAHFLRPSTTAFKASYEKSALTIFQNTSKTSREHQRATFWDWDQSVPSHCFSHLGPLLGWWRIQFHERRCSMPHNLKFFN